MKRQNTSLIMKAIILLLALIIMVFAGSVAWFTQNPLVNADGLSLQATGSKYFDMAVGFQSIKNNYNYTMSQYTKNLNLRDVIAADGEHYDVLADFSPVDITGDGVTLVRPSMTDKNKDIDRTSNTYSTVSPNKEYICFDMYFRSDEECIVFLDKGSFVKGAVEDRPGDGKLIQNSDADGVRKAKEGNFSKDAVVGAVRIAFVNYDRFFEGDDLENRKDEVKLLWLPRPDIHINSNSTNKNWTLSTNVQPGQIIDRFGASGKFEGFPADTYTHHYYSYGIADDGQRIGDVNYDKTVTDTKRLPICEVNEKIGEYYYGKTQVNLWIEGCDSEARRAVSGGQFQVNFDLAGG